MQINELKLIFTGTMGAGKTTAISTISEIPLVSTEAANLDQESARKATTTVAMDYGEVTLDDGDKLRLYGTPGQERFRFMWEILARGALGVVILVDNARPDPLEDLGIYLDNFSGLIQKASAVIGITRTDIALQPTVDDYYSYLIERGIMLPVFVADVRQRADVLMLVDALLSTLELAVD